MLKLHIYSSYITNKGRRPFPNAAGKDIIVHTKGRKPLNAERGILKKRKEGKNELRKIKGNN